MKNKDRQITELQNDKNLLSGALISIKSLLDAQKTHTEIEKAILNASNQVLEVLNPKGYELLDMFSKHGVKEIRAGKKIVKLSPSCHEKLHRK